MVPENMKGSYSRYATVPLILTTPEFTFVSSIKAWSKVVLPLPTLPIPTNKSPFYKLKSIFYSTAVSSISTMTRALCFFSCSDSFWFCYTLNPHENDAFFIYILGSSFSYNLYSSFKRRALCSSISNIEAILCKIAKKF